MHRDRSGDLVEDVAESGSWHDPRCRDGWLPETVDARPVPCLVCRPHIGQQQDRRRRQQPLHRGSSHARETAMRSIRTALDESSRRRTSSLPNAPLTHHAQESSS